MAFVVADRVQETSTTTGTGTYTLAGAVAGYQSFAAIGNGNTTFYVATDGVDWECGVGTYTASGTTLARTTVLVSSNAGAAIDWAAGTRQVFVSDNALRSIWNLAAGIIKNGANGQLSAVTITAAGEAILDDADASAQLSTLGFSAFIKTLIDDADAPTALATLGALALAGGTMTGALTLNADPSSALHAATKQYVDSIAINLGKRARVRAATTGNVTISTALNNGDSLDGVTLATGDLVLVKSQSTQADNGVYVVGTSPARSAEFDTYNEHPGSLIAVAEGTANADTMWLCTSNEGGTLNSTAIVWTQLRVSGELLAANNLSELADAPTARSNLGLGTAATASTGTTDGNVPVYGSGAINMADKILQRPALKDIGEVKQTVAAASTTDIDLTAGNVCELTQNTNITTFTFSNPPASGTFGGLTVIRVKDASGTTRSIVWPTSVDWAGGVAPTLTQTTGAVDVFVFFTFDGGTRWHGAMVSADSK